MNSKEICSPISLQRVKDKLDLISKYYDELNEDFPNSEEEFSQERVPRRAIEKTIELIADAVVDVAMIIISSKSLEKPKESSESIAILAKSGFLSSSLAGKMKDFIRFRNLLVHQYAKVDEEKEFETIRDNHKDILEFLKEMEVFVKTEGKKFVKKKK
jgi:uncharacterized protein YutE (UPF0331/DUF86 family)